MITGGGARRPILEVSGLGRRFGERLAVADLSLEIDGNETVGLCGVNGAGKTTTLRLLAGYLRADAGRIVIEGHDLAREPSLARGRVGYLSDGAPFPADATVAQCLRYRARLKGLRRAAAARAADDVIERCGLQSERRTLCGQLSRGYRQRVGVADALLGDPALLLLDEPTSGLDPVQVRELRSLLGALAGTRAILLSSHALHEVGALCSRILVLHDGRLVADKTPLALTRLAQARRARVTVRGDPQVAEACLRALPSLLSVERAAAVAERDVDGHGEGERHAHFVLEGELDVPSLCALAARTLCAYGVDIVALGEDAPMPGGAPGGALEGALLALTAGRGP